MILSKKPYLEILNEDCNPYIQALPDNAFDWAIVDPPYGIMADKAVNKNTLKKKKRSNGSLCASNIDNSSTIWDNEIPDENYFKELLRISKNQIIWGINYYPYALFKGGRIYWDNNTSMPNASDGELAYCSSINRVVSVKYTWNGLFQEEMKHKEKRIHPTQKPIFIYKWILKNFIKPGESIIDTHLGSASNAIACFDYKNPFVGLEMDPSYFEMSVKRIKTHMENHSNFLFEERDINKRDVFKKTSIAIEKDILL